MTTTFKSDHRAKCWWDNRNLRHEHPFRTNLRSHHVCKKADALCELLAFCLSSLHVALFERCLQLLHIHRAEDIVDSFSTDLRFKERRVLHRVAVVRDFVEDTTDDDRINFLLRERHALLKSVLLRIRVAFLVLGLVFAFKLIQEALLDVLIHLRDDVARKVDDLLEIR